MTDSREQDVQQEQQLQNLGLTEKRVTLEQIDALMARVQYRVGVIPGTTSTVAHVLLDGAFFLGSGFSACVNPANFNAEFGADAAMRKAEAIARDKLWELEGYRLYTSNITPS